MSQTDFSASLASWIKEHIARYFADGEAGASVAGQISVVVPDLG